MQAQSQPVMNSAPAPAPAPFVVQYQASPVITGPRVYNNLACKQMRGLGIIQILCGVGAFIFNIVGITVRASLNESGYGFWCGIFFIMGGGFALGAAKHKSMCMIVTCMVMSIIAACMTTPLLILTSIGLSLDNEQCRYNYNYYYYTSYTYYPCNKNGAGIAMNAILLAISLIEALVSIWQSALCCAAVCCCAPRQGQPMSTVTTVQYVYTPTGWQAGSNIPTGQVAYVLPNGGQVSSMQVIQPQYQQQALIVPGNVPIYPPSNASPYPTANYPPNGTVNMPSGPVSPPGYSNASAPPPYSVGGSGIKYEIDNKM